jgi:hypothetical protein
MPGLDPTRDADQDDEEYLADAYAALDDDQRKKAAESAAETVDVDTSSTTTHADAELQPVQPTTPTTTAPSEPGTPALDTTAEPSVGPSRRVLLIDNKEYPDPDPELPITGTRSVQALYRDYFPGQLDNVDVTQKTRADGTVEVTFKCRIGTKVALSERSAAAKRAAPAKS